MRRAPLLMALTLILSALSLPAFAIQCVPYAREASGIQLKGDAWQWWNAAAGVYERGRSPREGGVLVFARQGKMRHGHVSVVTRVVSNRVILVDHANWAPIRSRGRGEVTTDVSVIDVSPKNDWSQVRVWYAAAGDYGHRTYRADGFVWQPGKPGIGKKPAIQQAALDRAVEMFPTSQPQAAAKVEPASVAQTIAAPTIASPTAIAPVVVTQPVAVEAVAVQASANSSGMVRVAKAMFRRADSDALPFN